ncbi:MAG: hypothetical protein U9P70_02780 [Patescibacteria group bacterium]|nr:hypothetical protein [Patescibacteria group bacterium]
MQDFFKSLFIKFEITIGSTALSGLWSQRSILFVMLCLGAECRNVGFWS